jgi:hypothetical protein
MHGADSGDSEADYTELVRKIRATEYTHTEDGEYWLGRLASIGDGQQWRAGHREKTFNRVRTEVSVSSLELVAAECATKAFTVIVALAHRALSEVSTGHSVVSVVTSTRPADGSGNKVIGCFLNQVPLIATNNVGESLKELINREARSWSTDLKRRNYPFIGILEELRKHARHAPRLDRVLLSYRKTAPTVTLSVGVTVDLFCPYQAAKSDLSLRFLRDDTAMAQEVEWDSGSPAGFGLDVSRLFERTLR